MRNAWIVLMLSIMAEVSGTTALKLSDGFTRVLPGAVVVVMYALSFWGLSLVLKKIDIGTAYAVWSGLGTAMVALVGVLIFQERFTLMKSGCILLIIAGVVGLHLSNSIR